MGIQRAIIIGSEDDKNVAQRTIVIGDSGR